MIYNSYNNKKNNCKLKINNQMKMMMVNKEN